MTANKHTTGPWSAHKADDLHGHDHFVMTPNGFLGYMPKDSEGVGAQLFTSTDARLIAAAPELLENLIGCMEALASHAPDCIEVQCARAAIAKAGGAA